MTAKSSKSGTSRGRSALTKATPDAATGEELRGQDRMPFGGRLRAIPVEDGRSKHDQLKEHVVNEILAGRLKPGQLVPSVRDFVEALGVARMTVCQAMASLEQDGIIRRVQGKGTFVEADVRRKLNRGQDIFALVVLTTHTGFYPS